MRIRSIRPEFWSSQDVTLMNWETRLIYIGLWSYVDDNGVGVDNPRHITTLLFPGDITSDVLDDDPNQDDYQSSPVGLRESYRRVTEALQYLSTRGHITRYEVDGKHFLHIKQWKIHQRVPKPSRSRYPLPTPTLTCEDSNTPVGLPEPYRNPPEKFATGEGEKGRRGEVKDSCSSTDVENDTDTEASITTSPTDTNITTKTASKQKPGPSLEADFETWWTNYPRKQGKGQAIRAYRAARRKTTAETLHTAVQAQLPSLTLKGREFTPLPATWLNGERWLDEDVDAGPPDPWAHLNEWQPEREAIEPPRNTNPDNPVRLHHSHSDGLTPAIP